jgi:CBS domain-containing protein
MSAEIVTVTPQTLLKDAATVMLDAGVSGLPVVDDGRLVGIITEADFVDRHAANDPPPRNRLLGVLFGRREGRTDGATLVAEVMSADLVTVAPDMKVTRAARFMVDNDVKRLPVVDHEGHLVGVISRADVLRVFVRSDDEIAAELDELMKRGLLPVARGDVTVDVSDGVVTWRGKVDARVDAEMLSTIASRVDGVLAVNDELEWEVDSRIAGDRYSAYAQEGRES